METFQHVAPYLLSREPADRDPKLLHADLNFGNIFLAKEDLKLGKIRISAVIDWQNTGLFPWCLGPPTPAFIRYHALADIPAELSEIAQPDEESLSQMDEEERATALVEIELKNRHELYEKLTAEINPKHHRVVFSPTRDLLNFPISFARNCWSNGFIPLQDCLFRIARRWNALGLENVLCPIQFSESDVEQLREEAIKWQEDEDFLHNLHDQLGIQGEGWVENERYEVVQEMNNMLKTNGLEAEDEAVRDMARKWPY